MGVRRHCIDSIGSVRGCEYTGGQAWAIVVGDSDMYGGFNQFESLAAASTLNEQWFVQGGESVYEASLQFDTIAISHAWGIDTSFAVGINENSEESALAITPNPGNGKLKVTCKLDQVSQATIRIFDMSGQLVAQETFVPASTSLSWEKDLSNLPQGKYVVHLTAGKQTFYQAWVIVH